MSLDADLLTVNIPRVNWPDKSGTYNVVLLDIYGQSHLRFAKYKGETHPVILHRLANLLDEEYPTRILGLECPTRDIHKAIFGNYHIPELDSSRHRVDGMGEAYLDAELKVVSIDDIGKGSLEYPGTVINPEFFLDVPLAPWKLRLRKKEQKSISVPINL